MEAGAPASLEPFLIAESVLTCSLFYDSVKSIDDLEGKVFSKLDPPATSLNATATIRSVWRKCKVEAERKLTGESTMPEDWEVPLHTGTKNALTSKCKAAYGVEFRALKMPCGMLLGRVYREREKQALTVYPLARVRSLATQPHARERKDLGNGFIVQQGADTSVDMSMSPYGFWLSLTILLHAYVIIGVDGWCPLQVAMDYLAVVEERVWHKLSPGLGVVRAIELQHRTRWVELVRGDEALSLGEAIKRSIMELVGSWQFGTFVAGSGSSNQEVAHSGRKRQLPIDQQSQGSRRHQTNSDNLVKSKGGEEICRKYNLGKCTDPCPHGFLHVCDFKMCGQKHVRAHKHKGQ